MSKIQKLIMEYKDSPRSISVETGQFGAYHADQLIGLALSNLKNELFSGRLQRPGSQN
jgi:hypothetical protein